MSRPPADTAPLRLFTALWPGPVTRRALQAWAAPLPWPARARRARAADLHLTLHFLGAVPAALLPALGEALRPGLPRLGLRLVHARVWHGGTWVLEPEALPGWLLEARERQGERLRALGLALDTRPWRPHVTLAREARGLSPSALPAAPDLPWHSQGHVLVASRPGRPYELLQRFD